MNQMTLMGHLGADPEVRFTSSGSKVTTLRLAVNARRSGQDETLWWRVTLWGEGFDKLLSYCKKGSAIVVFGEMLKPEIYTNKEGKPQISLSLVAYHIGFSPFGKGARQEEVQRESSYTQGQQPHLGKGESPYKEEKGESHYKEPNTLMEDEIPF